MFIYGGILMSTWNKKNFSIYTSDERSALGLIEELGNQTNYNTEEIEKVKESDNKKVSHDEMNRIYKIDKKVAGYLIPLSTSLSEKSNEYPNVTTILFDEFLIDKSYIRYLDNEVETLLDLVYTVQRERENVSFHLTHNLS